MKKNITLMLAALALVGCATCREHPRTCAALVAVTATSLALSLDHGSNGQSPAATDAALKDPNKPPCYMQPNGSCR
jgi:hypothetical protein